MQQLGADEHCVQPADEEEQADAAEVLDPDDLVVGAEAEVAADALVLLLAKRRGAAQQPGDGVVGEAQADQEADHPEQVGQQQCDIVFVGRRLVFEAFPAVDLMADEPAEVVAGDSEQHRTQQVEADQPPPQGADGPGRGVDCRRAHSPRLVGSGR